MKAVQYSFCKTLAKGDKKTLDVSQYIIVIIKINFKTFIFLPLSIQLGLKKITVIFLLSIYSLSTLGMSLKSFYCCGNLKSVTVTLTDAQQNTCATQNATNDCCKIKYQFFKVKDDHVAGDVVSTPVLHFIYLHLFTPSFKLIDYPSEQIFVANRSNAPPLIHTVPDYIFNCVFRI
ncbi:MAG: HYC_CC_PP family protein [Ginsengibacter sp.]